MGCVYSRVEKEETVRRCKERKRLMKQLVSCRCEFAAALLAYLQSLRNTGATLRQFTEDESVVPGDSPFGIAMPPPSPLPLPPSPPPPPPFSPDSRKDGGEEEDLERGREQDVEKPQSPNGEESIDIDNDSDTCTPPPPPIPSSEWDFWDPFGPPSSNSSSPAHQKKDGAAAPETVEEEHWAETNTEFGEEEEAEQDGVAVEVGPLLKLGKEKSPGRVDLLVDDNSSSVSWFTKDSEMAMVLWSKKTLAGIVKELDDYFLKASAGGTEVVALLESNKNSCLHHNFATRGKRSKSAKVFSSLSWRWSSRSPLSSKDACGLQGESDACRSVSHCMTLDKLYAEEQRLYKEVKEEEIAKMKHKKKTLLLHKQETREEDWNRTEKTRAKIEELQSQIRSMQESINRTCMSISKLRDEEMHPQLTGLSSGLLQMWRTMYECHQVQNHIAQQANHLPKHLNTEPTTDSHRHATAQLEAEVTSWHNAFHRLLRSQREYAHVVNQWVRLTDCLPDSNELSEPSFGVFALCEEWQLALDRLPDKVAAEAIKSFISVIHSIGLQLVEERNLHKKSERLDIRLEKETNSLMEMEKRYDGNSIEGTGSATESLKHHPLSVKRLKMDALKKRAEEEKAKYLNSIRVSRAMTLNNLQTSLPNVFQAMTGFAAVCVQAFDSIHRRSGTTVSGHANCGSPL